MHISLTVVATIFNGESYINEFLSYISDFKPDAIVVVDNYSTDNSSAILEDHGVKVIKKKCTRGMGRNIAIENSNTEYVMVVDCDNAYMAGSIDLESLNKNKITIVRDRINQYAWMAFGRRELFIGHPFPDKNNGEDLLFISALPRKMLKVKSIDNFAKDLKRMKHPPVEIYKRIFSYIIAPKYHYMAGLKTKDIVRSSLTKGCMSFVIDMTFLAIYWVLSILNLVEVLQRLAN